MKRQEVLAAMQNLACLEVNKDNLDENYGEN